MSNELLQLGGVVALFALMIRELFTYLKSRKENGNTSNGSLNGAILKELQVMNNNHLNSLKEAIVEGNNRLIDSMHEDSIRIVEALGEIKGKLSK